MELPPLKLYKFHLKLRLKQAFTTKPPPPPPLPLVHNPQVTLWVGRHYSPITNSCGANLCTIPLCNAQWQTERGKISTKVVSSWVLMSTTHGHSRRNTNGQKEKIKREKDVKY